MNELSFDENGFKALVEDKKLTQAVEMVLTSMSENCYKNVEAFSNPL